MFGLLQGCGCGVVGVGATAKVQWPSSRLAGLLAQCGADRLGADLPPAQPESPEAADAAPHAPTVRAVQEHVVAALVASGNPYPIPNPNPVPNP